MKLGIKIIFGLLFTAHSSVAGMVPQKNAVLVLAPEMGTVEGRVAVEKLKSDLAAQGVSVIEISVDEAQDIGQAGLKLQFWILQSGSVPNLKLDLIYGWIIPTQSQKQGVWDVQLQASLLSELKKSTEIFRLWRLSVSQSGAVLFRLIEALCQDKSLAEAASAASMSAPDSKFSGLHLINPPLSVDKVFAPRPTVFLTAKIATNSAFGGCASPLGETPAWLASLFRLEKLSFWQPIGGERNPNVSELIAETLGALSQETGFKFLDTDSQRLGNIEWITFPTLNEQRNPLVRFDSIREKTTAENGDKKITAESASIRIDEGAFGAGTELVVRCRLLNGEEIISDRCESLTFSGHTEMLSFHAKEPISAILVGVWAKTIQRLVRSPNLTSRTMRLEYGVRYFMCFFLGRLFHSLIG